MDRSSQLLEALLVAMLAVAVSSFPSGAPLSACGHLMPIHEDAVAQETAPPFLILLSSTNYTAARKPIIVTVTGPQRFLAFMLQGRTRGNRPVGHFEKAPPVAKFMSCYGGNDTISHAAAFGRKAMQAIWYPPAEDVGDIIITGSIAETKYVFWAVESQPIHGKDTGGGSGAARLSPPTCALPAIMSLVFICGRALLNFAL